TREAIRLSRGLVRRLEARSSELAAAKAEIERLSEAQLRRRLDQLEALYSMTDRLSRAASLDDVLEESLRALERAIGADGAAVFLSREDGSAELRAARGRAPAEGEAPALTVPLAAEG